MRGINSVPMKGSRKTVSTINPTAAEITIQRCPIRLRNKLLYPNNWISLPASLHDKSVAHEMYYAFVSDPGNYCKYVLGMLGFEQLKTKAQSELSDKFNLKNFHQYILDMGPVQFDILFNNLDAWIKKEK